MVDPNIAEKVGSLSKVITPVLGSVIPAAVTAVAKWAYEHTRSMRRVALTDRLIALTKAVREMPDVEGAALPRSVLMAEIQEISEELVQARAAAETRQSRAVAKLTGTTRFRAALLLYRPRGIGAWMLHVVFYWTVLALIFGIIGFIAKPEGLPETLGGLGILGVPPLIARHYALRLRRSHADAPRAKADVGERWTRDCEPDKSTPQPGLNGGA